MSSLVVKMFFKAVCDACLADCLGVILLLFPRIVIEQWPQHYNAKRCHSALAYKPPEPEVIITLQERPSMS